MRFSAVGGGLLLFGLLEAGLFHTNFYHQFLEPDSSLGTLNFMVETERTRPASNANQILALGDSRMALRAWLSNQIQSKSTYGNLGISSSTPRTWFYELRDVDPDRNRYSAILIFVPDYDDEDVAEVMANRVFDAHLMSARLGISDLPTLLPSYPTWTTRWEVARGVIWKGYTFKNDIQHFLTHPKERRAKVKFQTKQWAEILAGYRGDARHLTGLTINWDKLSADFPERLSADERRIITEVLLREPLPQTGQMAAYNREWFGRIVERYRGTRTKLVFCRVPRGPLVRPDSLVKKLSSTIRNLPGVTHLDEHLLDELERPELFMDPLHLNATGCERFTRIVTASMTEHGF